MTSNKGHPTAGSSREENREREGGCSRVEAELAPISKALLPWGRSYRACPEICIAGLHTALFDAVLKLWRFFNNSTSLSGFHRDLAFPMDLARSVLLPLAYRVTQ